MLSTYDEIKMRFVPLASACYSHFLFLDRRWSFFLLLLKILLLSATYACLLDHLSTLFRIPICLNPIRSQQKIGEESAASTLTDYSLISQVYIIRLSGLSLWLSKKLDPIRLDAAISFFVDVALFPACALSCIRTNRFLVCDSTKYSTLDSFLLLSIS